MGRMMKTTAFHFLPFSRKQKQVLTWWIHDSVKDHDCIIADGAVRSGKTVCMALSFVMWASENFNGEYFGICGKTIGSFRRNVLAPLKRMCQALGYQLTDHRADNYITIRINGVSNDFYIFGGKDEKSQDLIQGITLAGLFCDEVALMPRSFVDQATARCSVDGSKFWFNCNPGNPQHWFNTEWIQRRTEKNVLYLHFTMHDNLSLSEAVRKRYENMYSGVFYDRYIKGLWVAAEGLIYDGFNRETHVVDDLPETEGAYFVSSDYGIQNATVFLLWRKLKNSDSWLCLREYYYSGRDKKKQKTVAELADGLTEMLDGIIPERIIIDPSAAALIVELRRRGYRTKEADNAVLDGIADVSTMLGANRLLFSSACRNTIEEFGVYCWDEKEAQRGEDRPMKEHDHAMDAVRYFVKTRKLVKRAGEKTYNSILERL